MKLEPVRRQAPPAYPTRLAVLRDPRLIECATPARWRGLETTVGVVMALISTHPAATADENRGTVAGAPVAIGQGAKTTSPWPEIRGVIRFGISDPSLSPTEGWALQHLRASLDRERATASPGEESPRGAPTPRTPDSGHEPVDVDLYRPGRRLHRGGRMPGRVGRPLDDLLDWLMAHGAI